MTTETLKILKVKSYKEAFKLYKRGEFGVIGQRMPENLERLRKSDGTDYERILSLLEEDSDNLYNVLETKKGFTIIMLGLSIHKKLTDNVSIYYLNYGEYGKFEEVVYKGGVELCGKVVYLEGCNGELTVGQNVSLKHRTKITLYDVMKDDTLYVKDGMELEKIRDALELMDLKFKFGYVYKDFLHEPADNGFLSMVGRSLILSKKLPKDTVRAIGVEEFIKNLNSKDE